MRSGVGYHFHLDKDDQLIIVCQDTGNVTIANLRDDDTGRGFYVTFTKSHVEILKQAVNFLETGKKETNYG